MRLPRSLAWVLVLAASFTAALLRRFHAETPRSPFVHPALGSLLFAGIVLLVLIGAREAAAGPDRRRGTRLGALTPLMLMLFFEKWVANTWYGALFYAFGGGHGPEALVDARFRAFAGAGLLAVCAILATAFRPARVRVARALRPFAWWSGTAVACLAALGTYALLLAAGSALGQPMRLAAALGGPLLLWSVGGQALRALAEEVYYRGLLLHEIQRVAPRLGLRRPVPRRWLALLWTSALFALEHFTWQDSLHEMARRGLFTFSLGVLLGVVVLAGRNIPLAAWLHAFANWILLGAVPLYVDVAGQPLLAPGVYIGLGLSLAFVGLYFVLRWRTSVT